MRELLEAADHLVEMIHLVDGEISVEEIFDVEDAQGAPTSGSERIQHLHECNTQFLVMSTPNSTF